MVSYDGVPVSELNRQVGYMTQKDTLLPWRTAADNIRIALELKCRAVPRARGGRARGADDRTGRPDRIRAALSGASSRAACASASRWRARSIYEPETLLMDEPFGALDAQLKLLMQDQLQQI